MHQFHKNISQEIKEYTKKKKLNFSEWEERVGDFPKKKLFNNMDKDFVRKRIRKINLYLKRLFESYPQKVPFTNALVDLCQPHKLNVAVIGDQGTGKSELILKIIALLKGKNKTDEE